MTTTRDPDTLRERLRLLGLWGLLTHFDEVRDQPWLERVADYEQAERHQRSLDRRLKNARIGSFKPVGDFDWTWPKKLDHELVEELFTLEFIAEGANIIFLGPNGTGKTTLAKNLIYQAIVRGHTARFTSASDMLNDLASQDSERSFAQRMRRYCLPAVLAIDEVGYLSYDARYADLLFEVVTRRANEKRPIVLTTNKAFGEWSEVFPNAGCIVTLVDRLVHCSEIVPIEGHSFRLREAKERAQRKAEQRKHRRKPGSSGRGRGPAKEEP
jgi:DNA replication protein DnaC